MLETWSSVFKNLKEGKFLNDDNFLPEPYVIHNEKPYTYVTHHFI